MFYNSNSTAKSVPVWWMATRWPAEPQSGQNTPQVEGAPPAECIHCTVQCLHCTVYGNNNKRTARKGPSGRKIDNRVELKVRGLGQKSEVKANGQGRRSRSTVKVNGRGQMSRSEVKI